VSRAQHELGLIDVAVIPERPGQLLRQALQQRMASPTEAEAKRYELSASFGVTGDIIGFQQDSTATRLRLSAASNWSLKRLDASNTLVTSGTARALDGFNIINGQYFALDLSNEATQRRLAEAVADRITLQLAAYFTKQSSTS
jgi:LPS-assembly lipoprotein